MDGPPGSHCGWIMPEHYDPVTKQRTINLPDGVYTLTTHAAHSKDEGVGKNMSLWLGNHIGFTVSGSPLTIPSEPEHSEPVPSIRIHIHFDFTDPKRMCSGIVTSAVSSPQDSDPSPSRHVLWLSRADPLLEDSRPIPEMISQDNSPEFSYVEPGSYWVHAVEPGNTSWMTFAPNTYVAAITAGGVDMSREPLAVGLNGVSPPLEVTLRNDCGTLQLNYLAPNPHGDPVGIVRAVFGLLVPQFAGFMNEHSFLFEPGRTQNISIGNLAPGHYKFYVVRQERGIAFKSSENTPTSLGPGQDVWLHPGEKEEISVVEPDLE
jgi:hypothetical protein